MSRILSTLLAAVITMVACDSSSKPEKESKAAGISSGVRFSADSAYSYIRKQVDFGPRVPGTDAHRRCAEFLASELLRHGADTLILQNAIVRAYNGDELPITNIMGQFNAKAPERILLAAHYDTRPWADNEDDPSLRNTPIKGANDGGSGVGVLLEIARQLGRLQPSLGVDILFVDAEDYGDSDGWSLNEETWCLGTQYWVKHTPYDSIKPKYGIVLDMVGGTNARFHREFFSNKTARKIVDKVWGLASREGFSDIFINEIGGSLVDDHIFIDRSGIPCIDIVECNNAITRSFPPTWHTLSDDMASIDTKPLHAVGTTVMRLINDESRAISSKK